jgi:hypothetical protein
MMINASEEQLAKEQRWPELIKRLQGRVDAEGTSEARVALLMRIAGLFMDKFSNVAEAIKVWQRVLEIDPDHPQANDGLAVNYEKRRDWDKLISLRKSQLARTTDPGRRTQLVDDIARLEARAGGAGQGSSPLPAIIGVVVGLAIVAYAIWKVLGK